MSGLTASGSQSKNYESFIGRETGEIEKSCTTAAAHEGISTISTAQEKTAYHASELKKLNTGESIDSLRREFHIPSAPTANLNNSTLTTNESKNISVAADNIALYDAAEEHRDHERQTAINIKDASVHAILCDFGLREASADTCEPVGISYEQGKSVSIAAETAQTSLNEADRNTITRITVADSVLAEQSTDNDPSISIPYERVGSSLIHSITTESQEEQDSQSSAVGVLSGSLLRNASMEDYSIKQFNNGGVSVNNATHMESHLDEMEALQRSASNLIKTNPSPGNCTEGDALDYPIGPSGLPCGIFTANRDHEVTLGFTDITTRRDVTVSTDTRLQRSSDTGTDRVDTHGEIIGSGVHDAEAVSKEHLRNLSIGQAVIDGTGSGALPLVSGDIVTSIPGAVRQQETTNTGTEEEGKRGGGCSNQETCQVVDVLIRHGEEVSVRAHVAWESTQPVQEVGGQISSAREETALAPALTPNLNNSTTLLTVARSSDSTTDIVSIQPPYLTDTSNYHEELPSPVSKGEVADVRPEDRLQASKTAIVISKPSYVLNTEPPCIPDTANPQTNKEDFPSVDSTEVTDSCRENQLRALDTTDELSVSPTKILILEPPSLPDTSDHHADHSFLESTDKAANTLHEEKSQTLETVSAVISSPTEVVSTAPPYLSDTTRYHKEDISSVDSMVEAADARDEDQLQALVSVPLSTEVGMTVLSRLPDTAGHQEIDHPWLETKGEAADIRHEDQLHALVTQRSASLIEVRTTELPYLPDTTEHLVSHPSLELDDKEIDTDSKDQLQALVTGAEQNTSSTKVKASALPRLPDFNHHGGDLPSPEAKGEVANIHPEGHPQALNTVAEQSTSPTEPEIIQPPCIPDATNYHQEEYQPFTKSKRVAAANTYLKDKLQNLETVSAAMTSSTDVVVGTESLRFYEINKRYGDDVLSRDYKREPADTFHKVRLQTLETIVAVVSTEHHYLSNTTDYITRRAFPLSNQKQKRLILMARTSYGLRSW